MPDTREPFVKDPDSVEPIGFDWTPWLAEIGNTETLASSSWTVTDGPDSVLTLSAPAIVVGLKGTQVTLTAGTSGGRYTVTNHIVTSSSYRADQSRIVEIQDL